MGWIMANPRKYGKVGLFPSVPRPWVKGANYRGKDYITAIAKRAAYEFPWGHPTGWNGGSCCLQCHRILDKAQTAAREKPTGKHILPAECCNDCGRWPIDQALIDKGHLGVQSDPRWAVGRMKIADLRTTFAPGDKIIPSQREVANA